MYMFMYHTQEENVSIAESLSQQRDLLSVHILLARPVHMHQIQAGTAVEALDPAVRVRAVGPCNLAGLADREIARCDSPALPQGPDGKPGQMEGAHRPL